MKHFPHLLLPVLGLLGLTLDGCTKKVGEMPNPESSEVTLKLYPATAGTSSTEQQLQFSMADGDDRYFATLGRFSSGQPQPAQAAFLYDKATQTQTMMLYDAQQHPAYFYGTDLATGERKPELVEVENVDATTQIVRLYHYSWASRLGTLLLESRATKTGSQYTFTKQFEIADPTFAGRQAASQGKGDNISSPAPVPSFDLLSKSQHEEAVSVTQSRGTSGTSVTDYMQGVNTSGGTEDLLGYLAGQGNRSGAATLTLLGASSGGANSTGTAFAAAGTILSAGASTASCARQVATAVSGSNSASTATAPGTTAQADASVNGTARRVRISCTGPIVEIDGRGRGFMPEPVANTMPPAFTMRDFQTNVRLLHLPFADLDDLPNSSGVLQFGLSWNTATDIDLWVTDPSGTKIYYGNRSSSIGGYLDRDDTDGYGPENVYYRTNIRDGNYLVQVHYYGSGPSTLCTIKATNGLGFLAKRTVTLAARGAIGTAFTIRKTGNSFIVQ